MKLASTALALSALALLLLAPRSYADAPADAHADAHAEKWSLLRSKNGNVEDGNQRLAAGDAKGALAAYDRAARELPSEGGVHLNRGLALLRSGDLPKAREALHLGSQPPATADVRADAYYDLGIAFYKEADQRAGEQKHDEAQKLFREAADSFKQALRKRPGDRNTAWNYELAARRIREQEQEQKKQDEEKKKQDQQKQDQQNKDQQKQDQQNPDQQKQDQQNPDQQKQDQAKNDQQKQDQQNQKPQDQQGKQDQQQQPQDAQQQPPAPRPEVDRALDALQDGEENLERMRAMNRAARERRKPDKDW